MKKLEADVEKPVLAWVKKNYPKVLIRKMNGLGFNHWPDRLFCVPGGKPFWVEFKRPGKGCTPMQAEIQRQLKELGYDVEVHDTVAGAKSALLRRLPKSA